MRRHVCQTCRHQARAASTLSKSSRRYVQISATPSSSAPVQQSVDATTPGAGRTTPPPPPPPPLYRPPPLPVGCCTYTGMKR